MSRNESCSWQGKRNICCHSFRVTEQYRPVSPWPSISDICSCWCSLCPPSWPRPLGPAPAPSVRRSPGAPSGAPTPWQEAQGTPDWGAHGGRAASTQDNRFLPVFVRSDVPAHFYPIQSVPVHFCLCLSLSVCFCQFFSLFLSVFVRFCQFLSYSVHFCTCWDIQCLLYAEFVLEIWNLNLFLKFLWAGLRTTIKKKHSICDHDHTSPEPHPPLFF